MSDVLDEVREFRTAAASHARSQPRALPDLPSGTFEVVDTTPGAPVPQLRVYHPAVGPDVPGVFVNLHGGGFVLGGWQDDDPYCRFLADASGCAVVNVDYPLAPEDAFPAALHQTYDVLGWIADHGRLLGVDGARLAVGGHSAGGNLAAASALLARRHGRPLLRGVVVDHAPLDLATSPADELASPVRAQDLGGLPPTLVITAEHDLLRAEGDRYAARLSAAGVDTEHVVFPGCGHGFTHVGPEEQATAAWLRMATFLRRVLGEPEGAWA
ncbi:carboxylesterase [Cellulomonas chitinilytica]|uniref:Carboxylesterase n=1 Tax=Cellulomonas chitinilytica TaxID=398759 RepID=A0A919P7G4_9CELL|nr:alpha/beta hydrolase [Cellulomonas chitinilytica]GIG22981.1 carboxylesterase [Cellulomonas chitinilytica]